MVTVAFFELEQSGLGHTKQLITRQLRPHKVVFIDEPLSPRNAAKVKDAQAVAFFIYSKIDKIQLDALPNLKLAATMSTGYDHIDVATCNKRNVAACNVPAYGDNTVAEHAMSLLLAISRKLLPSVERTRRGSFESDGLRGFDLKGKTIGILGTGRIGRNMAHFCQAFGMDVIAYDKFPNQELAKECGFRYVSFNDLLKKSDVISIHLPYNKDTHHIINKGNVKKIKPGCVLINTARGGIIDTDALIIGLKAGIFSSLGLDVLEEETAIKEEAELLHTKFKKKDELKRLLEEHALMRMDNVIVTPHNAFNSTEAVQRIVDTTIDNIASFFKGTPKNLITKQNREVQKPKRSKIRSR